MENVTNANVTDNKKSNLGRIIKKTIIGIVIFYAIIVIIRLVMMIDEDKTEAKVKEIHGVRLTMSDVDGSKLPPMPDEVLNNSTVEGVDVNKNYVRDDVERWIFETYPVIEERAAWMQWAKARQLVMLKADSKLTLKAVMEEGDRASNCLLDIYASPVKKVSLNDYNKMKQELDLLVWNNQNRIKAKDFGFKYMSSFSGKEGPQCDVFKE